ncbi:MAG: hypothetical protein AB8B86_09380 [Pseudomonadales bacterium]
MNIEDITELAVRRWYSEHHSGMKALELWLSNGLSELTQHDQNIYSFKTRTKSISSLLIKIRSKLEASQNELRAKEVIEQIDDLVGARVLVYHPSKVLKLHELFTSDTLRTHILDMTIHSHEYDPNFAYLQKLSYESSFPCKLLLNNTGYSSFHYVLQPIFHDDYYSKVYQDSAGIKPFPRYELQVRTIIQETWSEVQHKLIYKGSGIKPIYTRSLSSQFANLARMLNLCDKLLDGLNEPNQFAPTKKIAADRVNPEFGDFLEELHKSLEYFEAKKLPISERYQEADVLFQHYKREISEYSCNISEKTLGINLELSEYYLKSGHYKEALELFQKMESVSSDDAWIYLRAAESCSHSPEYFKEGKQYIGKLYALTSNKDRQLAVQDMDDVMCYHGSLLAQEFELFDIAEFFAWRSVKLTPEGDESLMSIRSLHQLDCKLDLWEPNLANIDTAAIGVNIDTNRKQIMKLSNRLFKQISQVEICIEHLSKKAIENDARHWGTLARFYYWLAKVSNADDNMMQRAHIVKASRLMDNCFAANSQNGTKPSEAIYDLSNKIRSLLTQKLPA